MEPKIISPSKKVLFVWSMWFMSFLPYGSNGAHRSSSNQRGRPKSHREPKGNTKECRVSVVPNIKPYKHYFRQ